MISASGSGKLAFADSPLTSTTFYQAYLDVLIVKQADQTHRLDRAMGDYLLNDQNPFDVKLAVINALSWEENVSENVQNLLDSLQTTVSL